MEEKEEKEIKEEIREVKEALKKAKPKHRHCYNITCRATSYDQAPSTC